MTTAYNAEFTTVTDQTLRVRRSRIDGLGRLVRVDEPDATAGNLDDVNGNPVQSTSYIYDALGNLRQVTQGAQQRYFMYDSLSRLIRARNPEQQLNLNLNITDPITNNGQWCMSYDYDNNANLLHKTDARGVVSTFGYDALNRNLSVVYTNDPANTPAITRTYDTAPFGKGRLRSTQTSGATGSLTTIDTYNALGQATGVTQTMGTQNYLLGYTYDLAGHVKTINYPSGHTVTNNYDNAGRTNSFTGKLGDNTLRNYATGISYSPSGGLSQEQLGTTIPIYNKLFYNSRGQLAEIREGLTPNDTSWQRGAIINFYSTCWGMCFGSSMTDNNGNLKGQEHWIPDSSGSPLAVPAQQFEYDQLNRLKRVYEGVSAQPAWQQQYAYDSYGNRRIDLATGLSNPTNLAAVVTNTTTNRMYAPGETEQNHPLINYDLAGNQNKDYYSESTTGVTYDRSYDAENRMTSSTATNTSPVSTQVSTYTYDGNSQRVRRNIDNVETWQVYGLGGELLAEYAANGPHASPQKEYGYRNGQLLITATAATSWGNPPVLNDNPLVVGATTVQSRHITELRAAINALRTHLSLSAYSWQQAAGVGDSIKADPIIEMRTALDQALGPPSPAYSAGLAQGQLIKAIHIQELRNRVLAAWASGGTDIRWLVSDQLGTPRMIFDLSGSLAGVSRHDYLPFGGDLSAGGRTTSLGYGATDGARQKFTSKERDIETGLDYFLARYYSNVQGRFTSVDPDNYQARRDLTDPQSWNAYSYVNNNPLTRTDPNGKAFDWLRHIFQRFNNKAKYGHFETNDQIKQRVANDRTFLLDQERQAHGNLYYRSTLNEPWRRLDINNLSDGQVLFYANSWRRRPVNELSAEQEQGALDLPPIAGVSFPPVPRTPPNTTVGQFGKDVMRWGTGDAEARARAANLTREELERSGVTRELAEAWRDFYKEVVKQTPGNPSAAGRADLMQRAVELLGGPK